MPINWTALSPILLLIVSNVFMTFAWYGQLNVRHRALWIIVLISWGIAFFEYCLAVPANRIGRAVYDPAELKAIQEVITLVVFAVFSVAWLKGAGHPESRAWFRLHRPGRLLRLQGAILAPPPTLRRRFAASPGERFGELRRPAYKPRLLPISRAVMPRILIKRWKTPEA